MMLLTNLLALAVVSKKPYDLIVSNKRTSLCYWLC